jgi:hypothetical protein
MIPVYGIVVSLAFAGAVPAETQHELALVRIDGAGEKKHATLSVHPLDAEFSAATAATAAIDKLSSLGPSAKLFAVFAAEFDGKSGDEIVIARGKHIATKIGQTPEKPDRLDVDIFATPKNAFAKKPKLIASFASDAVGSTTGDGRVTALGPIDHDGDGRDSLAIVRTYLDGRQELTIHPVLIEKNQALAPPIASDPQFGMIGAGEALDFARVPSISGSDLLVIRKLDASGERVELRSPPAALETASGPIVAYYSDVSATDGAVIDRMATMALPREDSPFPDYAIVFERMTADGERRVELAWLPIGMGVKLPSLTALSLEAAEVGDGDDIRVVFGVRRAGD